jgi:5-methyltetrahydrofolate--homocysteine methyltransferase
MTDMVQKIGEKLYGGDIEAVAGLVQDALDTGMAPGDVLKQALLGGMDVVGKDFKAGVLFVPEVMFSARAMQAGMDVLRPLLADSDLAGSGKCVLGTVKGDLHDIGKNLVRMMLDGGGFEAIDLGVDLDPSAFVEAVREHKPDVVGMSALLTTTMAQMKVTIDALEEAGLRDSVKIMIGGAPVTAAFAEQIGADGYAPDAASAVDVAWELKG